MTDEGNISRTYNKNNSENFNSLHDVIKSKKNRINLLSGVRLFGNSYKLTKDKQLENSIQKLTKKDIKQRTETYLFVLGQLKDLKGLMSSQCYCDEFREYLREIKTDGHKAMRIFELVEAINLFCSENSSKNKTDVIKGGIVLARSITTNYILPSPTFCVLFHYIFDCF